MCVYVQLLLDVARAVFPFRLFYALCALRVYKAVGGNSSTSFVIVSRGRGSVGEIACLILMSNFLIDRLSYDGEVFERYRAVCIRVWGDLGFSTFIVAEILKIVKVELSFNISCTSFLQPQWIYENRNKLKGILFCMR